MDRDQLDLIATDDTQLNEIEKASLGPAGYYETIPEWSSRAIDRDEQPLFRFVGAARCTQRADGGTPDDKVTRLDVTVNFNPKPDNPADQASRRYVELARAFREAYGRPSKHAGELADYITRYPVRLRAIQLDAKDDRPAKLWVAAIYAVKQG